MLRSPARLFAWARRLALPVLLLAVLASLPACDRNREDEGYFQMDVRLSSGSSFALDGRALFCEGERCPGGTTGESFTVEFVPFQETGVIFEEEAFLARSARGVPEAGRSYDLVRPEAQTPPDARFIAVLSINASRGTPTLYQATSGEVEIGAVTEDRIEGRFSFSARRARASDPGPAFVTVENGLFEAERSDRVGNVPR